MIKTLEQINREFMEEHRLILPEIPHSTPPKLSVQEKPKEQHTKSKRAADILLYSMIAFIVFITIILNGDSEEKVSLFGYSGFAIFSESMQSEIPKGALVLVQKIDPDDIKAGDDITYIRRKDDSAVTHRVVSIHDHYGEKNDLAFVTQGIENSEPDEDIVYSDEIVGIVRYIVPGLGSALHHISVNIGIILLAFGGVFVIVVAARKCRCSAKNS